MKNKISYIFTVFIMIVLLFGVFNLIYVLSVTPKNDNTQQVRQKEDTLSFTSELDKIQDGPVKDLLPVIEGSSVISSSYFGETKDSGQMVNLAIDRPYDDIIKFYDEILCKAKGYSISELPGKCTITGEIKNIYFNVLIIKPADMSADTSIYLLANKQKY